MKASDIFTAPSGASGTSGYSAWSGTSGRSGFSAWSGVSGIGTSGYSGTSGRSGWSGTSAWSGALGISDYQNVIDNPGMAVSQRYAAAATTGIADDAYFIDRWYALTQTTTITSQRSSSDNVLSGWKAMLKQDNASAQRLGMAQIVPYEKSVTCRGRDMVLQAKVYQDSGGAANVRLSVLWWTGTADAVTSEIVNDWTSSTYTTGNFFASTSLSLVKSAATSVADATWTNISLVISAAEIGAASAANRNLIVFIHPEATLAQNKYEQVSDVDFFPGTTTRTFQANQIGMDEQECRRYLQVYGGTAAYERVGNGTIATSAIATIAINPPVTMRAAAAVTYSDVGHWTIFYGNNAISTCTAISVSNTSPQCNTLNCTATGTPLTPGEAATLGANATTAARLYLSAEI